MEAEEEEEHKCSKIYIFVSVSLRSIYTGNFGYTFYCNFCHLLIANSNSVCKPVAILVRFLTTIGLQLTRSSNFEQQFHNKAGAHTLITKWHGDKFVFPRFCFCERLSNGFRGKPCCCLFKCTLPVLLSVFSGNRPAQVSSNCSPLNFLHNCILFVAAPVSLELVWYKKGHLG